MPKTTKLDMSPVRELARVTDALDSLTALTRVLNERLERVADDLEDIRAALVGARYGARGDA